ncbi:MAG: pyrroline-5-carboxylate reductase [Polyangiales bacterium]
MTLSQSFAFIGGGNMAGALIHGLIETGTARAEQVLVSDVRPEGLAQLHQRYGVRTSTDNREACRSDVVILSVKPQIFPALLPDIAPHLGASSLVISIAAGVPLAAIEAQLPAARVVRAMPNTPALASAGATALAGGVRASTADLALASAIFASVGEVVTVTDAQMDAVTALSGSGPAYVFLLVESLATAGAQLGLPPEVAAQLAAQTVYGAGKLLHESSDTPSELRRKVTSPGGTTAAGLQALEQHGFPAAVAACLDAACRRGGELGREAADKLAAAQGGGKTGRD